MANGSPTNANRLRAAKRREEALRLRVTGLSTYAIAERMGVSQQAVSKMLQRALEPIKQEIAEKAEELRAIEVERLDNLMNALWPRAMRRRTVDGQDIIEGEPEVTDRILRIMKRRSELLGLDKPVQREIIVQNKVIDFKLGPPPQDDEDDDAEE